MLNRTALMLFIDNFYNVNLLPFYLLNKDREIIAQSKDFLSTPKDYFVNLLKEKNLNTSTFFTHFTKSEFYSGFPIELDEIRYVVLGPTLYYRKNHTVNLSNILFFSDLKIKDPTSVISKLAYLDVNYYPSFCTVYSLLYDELMDYKTFHESLYKPLDDGIHERLNAVLFQQREDSSVPYSYDDEQQLLHFIQLGNSTKARVYGTKIAGGRIGQMSEDQLRRTKYAVVTSIALMTRAVVEVGVSVEKAYSLSDVYIKRVDESYQSSQLFDLFMDAILHFSALVKYYSRQEYPKWIRECMEYIDQHLHEDISLQDLGDLIHMAPAYISVQFHKICGFTIKQYMNKQRIAEAKYLLKATNLSIQEISLTLNYTTQSYFTKVFKEVVGKLPNEYRISHR